jgi:hypothetical protein
VTWTPRISIGSVAGRCRRGRGERRHVGDGLLVSPVPTKRAPTPSAAMTNRKLATAALGLRRFLVLPWPDDRETARSGRIGGNSIDTGAWTLQQPS